MPASGAARQESPYAPPPPGYIARPDPLSGVWRQIESSADMIAHSLEVGVRGSVTRYFTGMIQYILGRAYNSTGGNPAMGSRSTLNSFPANNYDLSGEWARATTEVCLGILASARSQTDYLPRHQVGLHS